MLTRITPVFAGMTSARPAVSGAFTSRGPARLILPIAGWAVWRWTVTGIWHWVTVYRAAPFCHLSDTQEGSQVIPLAQCHRAKRHFSPVLVCRRGPPVGEIIAQ